MTTTPFDAAFGEPAEPCEKCPENPANYGAPVTDFKSKARALAEAVRTHMGSDLNCLHCLGLADALLALLDAESSPASEPYEKYVVVANQLVEELTAHPSEPVTVQIREIAPDGRLEMVFTRAALSAPAPSDEAETASRLAGALFGVSADPSLPSTMREKLRHDANLVAVRAVRAAEVAARARAAGKEGP